MLPRGEAKAETLRIRVTPRELRGFGAKARAEGKTVSEWVRSALLAAAGV